MTIDDIRKAYAAMQPFEVIPPVPFWAKFDRAVVGILLAEIDRLGKADDTFGFDTPMPESNIDPVTREDLTGKTEPCCECCEPYPRADLAIHGEIFCAKCRVIEQERITKRRAKS